MIDPCRRKFRLSDLERLVFAFAVVVFDNVPTGFAEDEASEPLPIPGPTPDVDPAVPGRLLGCIYNCQTGALGPPEPPSCSPSDPTPPAKNVSSDLRLLLLLLPTLPFIPSETKADGGPDVNFFPTRIRHTPFPAPAAATAELLSVSTSELPAAASVEAVVFALDLGFHVAGD